MYLAGLREPLYSAKLVLRFRACFAFSLLEQADDRQWTVYSDDGEEGAAEHIQNVQPRHETGLLRPEAHAKICLNALRVLQEGTCRERKRIIEAHH
jgi:hypothetical protein